jgi:hypothetical protein
MITASQKNYLVIALKVLIFAALSDLLYKQVVQHREYSQVAETFRAGLSGDKSLIIFFLAVTMCLNWTLEIIKWRWLVSKIVPISLMTAIKGVLFGITFSLFTPNRVGEFGGRVVALPDKRGQAIVSTLLGSLSQIVMNLVMGGLGVVLYYFMFKPDAYLPYIFCFLWILLTVGLHLVYFNLDVVEGALLKVPILKKVKEHIDVVLQYDRKELLSFLALSGSRCLVYYFQYWLTLRFFGIDLPLWTAMILIGAIFFVQTVIPSFAIIELVFRGNVAISFLAGFTDNTVGVFSATFLLWIVNLIIPAVIGLLLFTQHRLIQNRS